LGSLLMPGGRIDPARPFIPLGIAVLTISDSREAATATSGDLLAERIVAAGHHLAARAVVRDSKPHIQQQLRSWIGDPGVDVIIGTRGAGLTGRGVAPEAGGGLLGQELEGCGVL